MPYVIRDGRVYYSRFIEGKDSAPVGWGPRSEAQVFTDRDDAELIASVVVGKVESVADEQ